MDARLRDEAVSFQKSGAFGSPRLEAPGRNKYNALMPPSLLREIKQRKPFAHAEEELFISLLRTSDLLNRKPGALLKTHGLSPAQYNVLRILRGARPEGLPCGEIGIRMVTRDPDITRLLDRLEHRRLVARRRAAKDRRVVSAQITAKGLALLETLDQPLVELHLDQLGCLDTKTIRSLLRHLEKIREGLG